MREKQDEEWLEKRRGSVGASEAAVLLGMTSWTTPRKIYAIKRGIAEDESDRERLLSGRLMEPAVAARWRIEMQNTGRGDRVLETSAAAMQQLIRDRALPVRTILVGGRLICRHKKYPWMHVTPDGLWYTESDPRLRVWEGKTWEVYARDQWEETPPEYVLTQVRHGIICLEAPSGSIGCYIGFGAYRETDVEAWSPADEQDHISRCREFMERVELGHEPPATVGDEIERPEDSKAMPADPDFLDLDYEYVDLMDLEAAAVADKTFRDVEKRTKEIKVCIKDWMHQHECQTVTIPDGSRWAWQKNGLRRKAG